MAGLPPELHQEHLFELVTHLNKGLEQLTLEADSYEVARLNLQAAQKAKNAIAYPQYLQFARQGVSILPSTAWETDFDLSRALHQAHSEA